jgi:hypothetical protein
MAGIINHPSVHAAASQWSESQTLHVAAAYSNPFRWRTRRELAHDFRRDMATSPNVQLHFAELAYGDRPHEVTGDHPAINDFQFRTSAELFHKENLLNLASSRFPSDWQYGAIIDADVTLTRHDWALEAIHQLQHFDFVQLFSSYTDLSGKDQGTGHQPLHITKSFMARYRENGNQLPVSYTASGRQQPYQYQSVAGPKGGVAATGLAWAFRRSAFETVGGLMDRCILGSGDWFMAFGLVSDPGDTEIDYRDLGDYSRDYWSYIRAWQQRAALLRKNIGYIDCHAIHHWHGPKNRRGYGTRDAILTSNNYSPYVDVFPDWQGVLQLTSNKSKFRDDIRRYFLSRSEDVSHDAGRT